MQHKYNNICKYTHIDTYAVITTKKRYICSEKSGAYAYALTGQNFGVARKTCMQMPDLARPRDSQKLLLQNGLYDARIGNQTTKQKYSKHRL